jgi:uncharacterized protein YgiM (DUF1202 family)
MRSRSPVAVPVLILLALSLIAGCQMPATGGYPVTPTYYYVTPSTTYLRDCPGYECGVVTEVYGGDRVVVLDRNDFGWSRVQLDRTGAIGWLPGELLSLSPVPANYYVAYNTVQLRECADYNCRALETLYRGDRVEKVDQDYRGWWRVMSYKSRNTGWIPASAVSSRPGPPYFYVDVSSLAFRSGPGTSYRMIGTLSLNQQVEMLGMGPSGWAQVRDVRSGRIGWVASRYLESIPVSHPRPVPRKRPAPKGGEKQAPPKAM